VNARYLVRPKADQDLDDQAFYLATKATPAVGHRFLVAAHETFSLLAGRPGIGWSPRLEIPELKALRVFRVSGFEKMLILYLPVSEGVDIFRVIHGSRNVLALLLREGLE
jgi:toxin ParE1/3/4